MDHMWGGYASFEVVGLISLASLILTIWGAWQGVRRAGYAGAWSLLLLVPLVNIAVLYVFAYSTWPAERDARN
jgi:hypothetical protein